MNHSTKTTSLMTDAKLKDLISLGYETEEVDYKVFLDLNSKKTLLELCVDAMAMANTRGGYIVIGVSDDCKPIGLSKDFHYDPVQIQQALSNYMKPATQLIYAERTMEIDGHEKKFAFLYVAQSKEVVIAGKDGNYSEQLGKTVHVFRTGEVFVRKGASSRRADSDSMRLLIERIAEKKNQHLLKVAKMTKQEASALQLRQMHNLQRPDYRQFIGREEYVEEVMSKLSQRFFIVSIDGIGGVGKTALATEIGYRCLKERLFDAIIWISAKKKRLILTGIDDIVPSLTSYETLLNSILEVLGFSTSSKLSLKERERKVHELLATAKCLIIVDNLETVEDERIFDFLKDLPEPSKALITSRKRLGEVERIVRLKEMSFNEAKKLILMDASDKSADQLLKASDRVLSNIYSVTGGIPLAIRWLVGWISTGHDVDWVCEKVKKSGSPVLDFCFREIYETLLTPEARQLLCIMPIFDHSPSKVELIAVLPMESEKFEHSISQLIMLSLINQEVKNDEQGTMITNYGILPLTLSFAQSKLSENRGLEVSARKKLGFFYQRQQRQTEALEQYGYALEQIGATTEKGKVAALQAQLAFAAYQRGNYTEAVALFKQAVEVDPNLAYTYQLWAMIERQEGNIGKADELFRQAATLNPNNPIVWRSWATMKRELRDLGGSEKILREGLKSRPSDRATIHSLAVLESMKGNYTVADDMFGRIYVSRPQSFLDRKDNMYVFAARGENYRKWGESEEKKNLNESAKDKYKRGLDLISNGLNFNPRDWNLIKNGIRLSRSLARVESKLGNLNEAEELFKRAIYYLPKNTAQRRHNSTVYYSRALNFLKMKDVDSAVKMCEESIRQAPNERAANLKESLTKR